MYEGLYHVLPTPERAGYARPGPGEIIRHIDPHGNPTNNWRLCCPFCGKRVHIYAEQVGNPEAPTFDKVLRCGCTARCGGYFSISAGRASKADLPGKTTDDIMRRAMEIPGVSGKPKDKRTRGEEKKEEDSNRP